MARIEANLAVADEALMFKRCRENVVRMHRRTFYHQARAIFTPRLRRGALRGYYALSVFEIASELGIKIMEADITAAHDVFFADECFLTGKKKKPARKSSRFSS